MTDCCIRDVIPADLDDLVQLCAEHAEYERAPYDHAGKKEGLAAALFSLHPPLFCLIAEDSNQHILGYAAFMPEYSTWDAAYYLHMDCLYLRPHARGRGIGRRLMAEIARRAPGLGCTQIQWQTPSFNERAIVFYNRLGATSRSKIRMYLDENAIAALAKG